MLGTVSGSQNIAAAVAATKNNKTFSSNQGKKVKYSTF